MAYRLKIMHADYNQLAIGIYGSDDLPPAYREAVLKQDYRFFISLVVGDGVFNRNGEFRTKRDAVRAVERLAIYNAYGLGWLKAKGGKGYCFFVDISELKNAR